MSASSASVANNNGGGNPKSPRSRHANRPRPFTLAMPSPQAGGNGGWDQDVSAPHSTQPSRPQSPSFYRSTVAEIHSVLYGGRGKDKEEITELVQDYYDIAATFENPVSMAKGPEQIAEIFFLLGLLPGQMWSELMEITESAGYDGGRVIVMTHVLHIATLPWLDPHAVPKTSVLHPSHSFYSSLPSTPYMTPTPLPGSPFSRTHPVTGKSSALWPIRALVSALNPLSVLSSLTTFHLKLHTRLRFNEQGKIIQHEDIWGIKEAVEGLFPILHHLYELHRRGVGHVATGTSRFLFRGKVPTREESASNETALPVNNTEGAGSSFRHGQASGRDVEQHHQHQQQHQQSHYNQHHQQHHDAARYYYHQQAAAVAASSAHGSNNAATRDRTNSHEQYLRSGYYAPVSVSGFENELALRLSPTSEKQRREAEAAKREGERHDDDNLESATPDADLSQVTTMDHDGLSD